MQNFCASPHHGIQHGESQQTEKNKNKNKSSKTKHEPNNITEEQNESIRLTSQSILRLRSILQSGFETGEIAPSDHSVHLDRSSFSPFL